MVERHVLVEDHHQVLDRRRCCCRGRASADTVAGVVVARERAARRRARAGRGGARRRAGGQGDRRARPRCRAGAACAVLRAIGPSPILTLLSSAGTYFGRRSPAGPPPGHAKRAPRRRTVSWLNYTAARPIDRQANEGQHGQQCITNRVDIRVHASSANRSGTALRQAARGRSSRSAGHPGQGQEVPAAERADVVDQRLVDQPLLHGLELPLDVLLEAGEDQPHVEVADRVDAAVVVVGPAQDAAVGASAACAGSPAGCARSAGSRRRSGRPRSSASAKMLSASSGKPVSRRRPIIVSCSPMSTRSQNSTNIRSAGRRSSCPRRSRRARRPSARLDPDQRVHLLRAAGHRTGSRCRP